MDSRVLEFFKYGNNKPAVLNLVSLLKQHILSNFIIDCKNIFKYFLL